MWAVVRRDDLNVRSGPGTEFPAIAQLDAGDLAKVIDINDAGLGVRGRRRGDRLRRTSDPRTTRSCGRRRRRGKATFGSMAGVASDGEAYLAYGSHAQFDYGPYELHGPPCPRPPLRGWNHLDAARGRARIRRSRSVATSDAGWVAVVEIPLGGTLMTFSADGETWEPPVGAGEGMSAVAHGPAGWVATGDSGSWTSVDGQSWDGPHAIGSGDPPMQLELESSADGYVAFDRFNDRLFTTVDGVAWTAIDHGGFRVSDAELVGDRVWAVVATDDGATSVRRGTVGAGGIAWGAAPTGIGGTGLHVDRISSGSEGMLAVGWDEASLEAVAWRSEDGATWQRVTAGADALSRVGPFEPVWGPAGWVGPDLERSSDGVAWLASDYELGYDGPVPPVPAGRQDLDPRSRVPRPVRGGLLRRELDHDSRLGWRARLRGLLPAHRRAAVAGVHVPAGDPLLGRPRRHRGRLLAHRLRAARGRPHSARPARHVGRARGPLQRPSLHRLPVAAEPRPTRTISVRPRTTRRCAGSGFAVESIVEVDGP